LRVIKSWEKGDLTMKTLITMTLIIVSVATEARSYTNLQKVGGNSYKPRQSQSATVKQGATQHGIITHAEILQHEVSKMEKENKVLRSKLSELIKEKVPRNEWKSILKKKLNELKKENKVLQIKLARLTTEKNGNSILNIKLNELEKENEVLRSKLSKKATEKNGESTLKIKLNKLKKERDSITRLLETTYGLKKRANRKEKEKTSLKLLNIKYEIRKLERLTSEDELPEDTTKRQTPNF
jgi:hypothetical protein